VAVRSIGKVFFQALTKTNLQIYIPSIQTRLVQFKFITRSVIDLVVHVPKA